MIRDSGFLFWATL